MQVQSLSQEDPLEEGTATHSSILDWKIPWTDEPCGLCMCVKLLQLCPILCDSRDCSPPGSLSVGFSRQEYWSELLCPPPVDLPHPEIEPASLISLTSAGGFFTTSAQSLQSCLTFCDPMHCSLPDSSVHGILQATATCLY